jgi:hypothetical protein
LSLTSWVQRGQYRCRICGGQYHRDCVADEGHAFGAHENPGPVLLSEMPLLMSLLSFSSSAQAPSTLASGAKRT